MIKDKLSARPSMETLEDRMALTAYVSSGNLIITCGNGNDSNAVRETYSNGTKYYAVTQNWNTSYIKASRVYNGVVKFYGNGGDDNFYNNTRLSGIAYGGSGNDFLSGGSRTDYLFGGSGDDALAGRGGKDYLYGQSGNDFLTGNVHSYSDSQRDQMWGGSGYDTFAYGIYWSGGRMYTNEDIARDFLSGYDQWRNDTP